MQNGLGRLGNLVAGLEGEDVMVTQDVDGTSLLEEVNTGSELATQTEEINDIVSDVTELEEVQAAVEDELEAIECVDQPLLETGTESDFKIALGYMQSNNAKLAKRLNLPNTVLRTSGLESNHGGYKEAFRAALEEKESLLKRLQANASATWEKILMFIKKKIQEIGLYFNKQEKSADKIIAELAKRTNELVEGAFVTDSDKSSIGSRFGAYLVLGEGAAIEKYADNYSKLFNSPVVPAAGKKLDDNYSIKTTPAVNSFIASQLGSDANVKDFNVATVAINGKSVILALASKNLEKAESVTADEKVVFKTVTYKVADADIEKITTGLKDIPSLDSLVKAVNRAKELAKGIKTVADANYANAESYAKASKAAKESNANLVKVYDKISGGVQTATLQSVSGMTNCIANLNWLASHFQAKYKTK